MPMLLDDTRFLLTRATSTLRRMLASLRTRGLSQTLERVHQRLGSQLARRAPAQPLWLPASQPFAPFAVPTSDAPQASIVIPVYGQLQMTLDCLRALAAQPPQLSIEIIVVDDGSPDDTAQVLPQVEGLHYHLRARNGGFIAACNDGAALARGEFIIFLNNDTLPQPGWLEALLATFTTHPDTGLAGAKLVYPDGRLQEAGGVVFADGSAWNYGRFDSPDDPRYTYVREADYLSGAAVAIPRALFNRIGGFDTRFAPAYYEDTDLAFAVRAAGLKTRYQPASVVVHREGATAGTDEKTGVKAYQVRNAVVFAEKWRTALAGQFAEREAPSPASLHAKQRQILVIDTLTPKADRDSGSLRLVNLMQLLQAEGAHVCFVAADAAFVPEYTPALLSLGIEVWHAPFIKRFPQFFKAHGKRFDVVMLSRHYVGDQFVPLVRRHAPQARVIFDTVDLHYLRERRGAETSGDALMRKQSHATQALELAVMRASDTTLVVSPVEREELAREAPDVKVEILSNLHQLGGAGAAFEARRDLLFVGGFHHPPNVDAVQWFADEVFARVRAQLPDVQFHIVGIDPPPQVQRLATQPGIIVHGHVPDLLPLLEGSRIALAPLRYGAGVKGKINQAMAHGLPVVATTMAVEGMHLRDGVDVLVGDTPEAFADAVARLYGDGALWQALATHGLANVQQHFSLDAARATVRRVFFDDAP
ncbi:Glycosyltransferase, GT2 family [Pseudoxanthomonas sp. GM95]|uniref:glycosyltransferase n=1 Tax=Pseudoxanthomonas sp. GM95 TaxID=1881043 RepID=UPI0008C52347|nr:glycosyltransferase [Pseudoxanthomonas sp. GM95]SEL66668.1 Glycosyltransferase, GT2 family [Pseudoxanthomonas sp. GM95]